MSMARKSAERVHCPMCGAPLRAHQLVQWIRWSDGVLQGPYCARHVDPARRVVYDEDGQLVAYWFLARLDGEHPHEVPLGADPREW